jgi:hypothetical protein
MADQNLILNILTFTHPAETAEFSFSVEKTDGLFSIHKTEWPVNIEDLFPKLNATAQYLYVNFEPSPDEKKLTVNLHKSPRFAKHYYQWLISGYFNKVASVSKPNFINDNEFWFWDKEASTGQFFIFKRFVIKVQIKRITDFPELVISYEGISKVFKEGLNKINAPTEAIHKVIYNRQLIPYNKLTDEAKLDLSKVRPVLSNSLRSAMGFKWEPNLITNKLKFFYNEISWFVKTHIDKPQFKEIIPVKSADFIQVPKPRTFNTTKDSNLLIFGNKKTDLNPFMGLVKNGPFTPTPLNKIEFILLYHENDRPTADKLLSWFDGKVKTNVKSLKDFLKMNYFVDINKSIVFINKTNPVPEIQQQIENWPRISGTRYLAIYITPRPKETTDKAIHSLYYKVKYELLKYGITSQVIETETINASDFNYSMPNIAIAILAKLEGVPWRLNTPLKNELIVGVGAFKNIEQGVQYIGSAFSFNNNGCFNRFEYFQKDEINILAGSIADAVRQYATINNKPDRLIIHFYKVMSDNEIEPIQEALRKIDLNIPIFIVTINKTESEDIVAFDRNWKELMPPSGTFINIGPDRFLLFNNTRYEGTPHSSADGYPFPIKLKIQCTKPELTKDTKTITELIDQVYQFSRMYWKSIRQQNLPVTIKYPEIIAEIAPHFLGNDIPAYGKDNLWFL